MRNRPLRCFCSLLVSAVTAGGAFGQDELQAITASDSGQGDEFGVAVAASGSVAVVRSQIGAYLLERTGGQWFESQKLALPEANLASNLGTSVALFNGLVAVGTPLGEAAGAFTGTVHLFERTTGGWTQTAELIPSGIGTARQFGYSVDIDEAPGPRRVLVGDPLWNETFFNKGGAFLFEDRPQGWVQIGQLAAFDGSASDWYGTSVALHGNLLAVGSRLDDVGLVNSGSVYLYRLEDGGNIVFEQKLIADDPIDFGEFGRSLDMTENWLAVSELRAEPNGLETGVVHLYERLAGSWVHRQDLLASESEEFDGYGISLDLEEDRLAVGACYHDGGLNDAGAAYLFEKVDGLWFQTSRFERAVGSSGDLFGWSLALADDDLLCGTLKDYGSGTGVPGTLHTFDATEPTACQAYSFGAGLDTIDNLAWLPGPVGVGAYSFSLVGPDLGELSILAISLAPTSIPVPGFQALIDPSSAVLIPMDTFPGLALSIQNLPPSSTIDTLYGQAFSYSIASGAWASSPGLRVALCP